MAATSQQVRRAPGPGARSPRPVPAGSPELIGPLLARLRLARGYSQLRLAELLCVAAGTPTVSRHEVSRWERQERIPGRFWLGWLAMVLEAPLERLEAAVAQTRRPAPPPRPARPADPHQLWRPPSVPDLLATLDHGPVHDLRELAHAWLAGPLPPARPAPPGPAPPLPPGRSPLSRLAAGEARLRDLRRTDDLVGGLDLAGPVERELRAAVELLRWLRGTPRRRGLRLVAGLGQLAGWAHADAGDHTSARRAYRVALRAAAVARDRPLAGYVLAGLSHQSLTADDPREALLLARTGYAGGQSGGTPLTRVLLLHRVALAAARAGERRAAELALADAERAAERADPAGEPAWLYWLDADELAAMTGRCWVVLGRPLRASRLLSEHPRPGAGPRTAALYGTWLARAYLALGEVELACTVAGQAVRRAVAAGSLRAADAVRHLHPLLLRHRDLPVLRRYEQLAADAAGFLPAARPRAPAAAPAR